MTVIELPDDQAASLGSSYPHPLQAVANIVLDAMPQIPPEAFINRPKDGASEHDHYLCGRAKRHS